MITKLTPMHIHLQTMSFNQSICYTLIFLNIFFGLSYPVLSQEKSGNVSFQNNSNNFISCGINGRNGYVTFLQISSKQKKNFDRFVLGSAIRCFALLDANSTTVFTYFNVTSAGVHEFLLDRVPCERCYERSSRWATIIVYPNGQADYTKYTNTENNSSFKKEVR
jgi:hypothetical protein